MNLLKNLRINRVDLVDAGANPSAFVTLMKRDDSMELPQELADRLEAVEKQAQAGTLTDEDRGVLARIRKWFTSAEDGEPPDPMVAELAKRDEQLAKANEAIAELRKAREIEQMIAKAREIGILGKPDDAASVLVKIKGALTDEEFTGLVGKLKAAKAQVDEAGLFKVLGHEGDDILDPYEKLKAMANERVAKSTTGEGWADAFDAVCRTPEGQRLYAEYKKEN